MGVVTLTIEPACYLRIPRGFCVDGKLVVAGTKDEPVFFEGTVSSGLSAQSIVGNSRESQPKALFRYARFHRVWINFNKGESALQSCVLTDVREIHASDVAFKNCAIVGGGGWGLTIRTNRVKLEDVVIYKRTHGIVFWGHRRPLG